MNDNYRYLPRRDWPTCCWIGRTLLSLLGWRISGNLPDLPKAVLTVAPHTSNWDWVIGMAAAMALDLDASWLGKQSLFQGPWGELLRKLGGIPVDRRHPAGIIEQVVQQSREKETFLFALSPEGTRKPVSSWKSGCCRIAHDAGIPLIPVALDYSKKTIWIFDPWVPGGETSQCLQQLSNFFQGEMAKIPKSFRPYSAMKNQPQRP